MSESVLFIKESLGYCLYGRMESRYKKKGQLKIKLNTAECLST